MVPPSLVPGDELIGNVVEVVADDMGLRSNSQDIVARALDQRALPAGRDSAESVPSVARNEAELRGLHAELFLDISVSLRRRLMVLHAIRAESPFKQIDDAAMLELAGLHFKQIVGEAEEAETRMAKLAQCRRNFGMGRHRRELLRKLLLIRIIDLDAARIS